MTETVTDSVGSISEHEVPESDKAFDVKAKNPQGCLDLRHFIAKKMSHRADMDLCFLFRHNARHTLEILTNRLGLSNSCHELLREGSLQ